MIVIDCYSWYCNCVVLLWDSCKPLAPNSADKARAIVLLLRWYGSQYKILKAPTTFKARFEEIYEKFEMPKPIAPCWFLLSTANSICSSYAFMTGSKLK